MTGKKSGLSDTGFPGLPYILLLALALGAPPPAYGGKALVREFINGGDHFPVRHWDDHREFYRLLEPGELFAVWHDDALGLLHGPVHAEECRVVWDNSLVAEKSIETMDSRQVEVGFDQGGAIAGLGMEGGSGKLVGMTRSENLGIKARLEGLVFDLRVADLLALYAEIRLGAEVVDYSLLTRSGLLSLFADVETVGPFLQFLEEVRLVTDEGMVRLAAAISEAGLDGESTMVELIAELEVFDLRIEIWEKNLVSTLRDHGLVWRFGESELRRFLKQTALASGMSEDDLRQLLGEAGLGLLEDTSTLEVRDRSLALKALSGDLLLDPEKRAREPELRIIQGSGVRAQGTRGYVTFTLVVTNVGNSPAVDVVVVDVIPEGLEFKEKDSGGPGAGFRVYKDKAKHVLVWKVDRIAAGKSRSLTFTSRFDI